MSSLVTKKEEEMDVETTQLPNIRERNMRCHGPGPDTQRTTRLLLVGWSGGDATLPTLWWRERKKDTSRVHVCVCVCVNRKT